MNATPTLGSVRAKLARGGALFAHDEMAVVVGRVDALEEELNELGDWWKARYDKRVDTLEAERENILTIFYLRDPQGAAKLCDESLDRSGALLGRIRDKAAAAGLDEPAAAPPEKETRG